MSLDPAKTLEQARRRAAAIRAPHEKEQVRSLVAAAALAVLGCDGAAKDLKGVDDLAHLGRTAAELGVSADALAELLRRARSSASARRSALGTLVTVLAERGDITGAEAAHRHLADFGEGDHDAYLERVVRAHLAAGDIDAAVAANARAHSAWAARFGWDLIVDAYCAIGRAADAEALLPRLEKDDQMHALAVKQVAEAHVRAGDDRRAEPLLVTLGSRLLAVLLGNVGAHRIAQGRIDDAFAAVARHRELLEDDRAVALQAFIRPLAARGAWDRAAALVADVGEDFDVGREWLRALAAAGRDADVARLEGSEPMYQHNQAVAMGMADRGELLAALRRVAGKDTVLDRSIGDAIRAHLAGLPPRAAVDWLLDVARTIGFVIECGGWLIEIGATTADPALLADIEATLATPVFAHHALGFLHERLAWRAVAADDGPRALASLRLVVARDAERLPYLTMAWGKVAAGAIARGDASTVAAVDDLLSPITARVHVAECWAEAARALGLRERGVITTLPEA